MWPRSCCSVRKQGMAILDDMTAISEEEPLPIIRAYIDLNLLTLHQVPPLMLLSRDCHQHSRSTVVDMLDVGPLLNSRLTFT